MARLAWEASLATHPGVMQRERSARGLSVAAALAAILAVLSTDAVLRGPWLDEFWTLELSDTRNSVATLARDGWLRDTHPPLFNLWATFLSSIGVTSIPAARLVSNLPAAGLLIWAAIVLSRRSPGQATFHAAIVLLTLSLPQSADAFANYRSYFWQIAGLATLLLVTRHVALTDVDLDIRKDHDLAAITILSIVASVALHYVGGVFGVVVVGVVACHAFTRGHRRWTFLMLATAVASGLFVVAFAALQSRAWAVDLDHHWIEVDDLTAAGVPIALIGAAILSNPVPLAGLWAGQGRWSRPELVFIAMMAGAIVAGVAVVLAINASTPIMVDRYVFPVSVLVCAIMAGLAAKLSPGRRLFDLLVFAAVAVVIGRFALDGAKLQWLEGARSIARIVADCPTTRVFAASGWALGPAAETRAARREDAVFARAYDHLSGTFGYAVQFVGQGGMAHAIPGRCPVVVWYEHTPNDAENDLRYAIAAAGLVGLEEARLSAFRSLTGFVIRADRR